MADIVARIAAGEIFQANLARAWGGWLRHGTRPFDLFAKLAASSPAPFATYLRLPDLARWSPTRQGASSLRVAPAQGADTLAVETRPIKGTVPRGATPAEDDALQLVAALAASERGSGPRT